MNRIIALSLSLLVLLWVLIGLACGPGANTNTNLGRNGTAANSNVNAEDATKGDPGADKACDESNLDNRQQQVNATIGNMIANNPDLANQRNANVFNYKVVKATGSDANTLYLY